MQKTVDKVEISRWHMRARERVYVSEIDSIYAVYLFPINNVHLFGRPRYLMHLFMNVMNGKKLLRRIN